MGANDRVHDWIVARQIDLVRAANGRAGEILRGPMAEADAELLSLLGALGDPGRMTPGAMQRVVEKIEQTLRRQDPELRGLVDDYARAIASDELEATAGMLQRVFDPLHIPIATGRARSASAAALSTPMRGASLRDWVSQLLRGDRERTKRAVTQLAREGMQGSAIARAIVGSSGARRMDGLRQITRRGLNTLLQGVTNHAAGVARSRLYDLNDDLISHERWVATLDGKTSAICRALDGRVFVIGRASSRRRIPTAARRACR